MEISLLVLHVGIGGVVFLIVLNGFLLGRSKAQIDAFLSLLLVISLTAAFWFYGATTGSVALGLSFVYGLVARPFAARLAGWLRSHPPS